MSINRLTRELRDLNPDIRIKAAMNLGEMRAAETLPTLINVFKKEENENVKSVIAEALANFNDFDNVIDALIFAKDNDKSEIVRVSADWAVKQIAKSRGYSDLQALLDDYKDDD
ncbi:MAG: HEAT repeat domain-containing protein [Asgard group archaeon]|nr:HEAT repeat domain-containing protein [Asgard group archaeon]